MKINNLTSTDYRYFDNRLEIDFPPTEDGIQDVAQVLAMDDSLIEVRTDDGDLVETFVGYTKQRVDISYVNGLVTLVLVSGSDAAMIKSMQAMQDQNVQLQKRVEEQAQAIEELGMIASQMLEAGDI